MKSLNSVFYSLLLFVACSPALRIPMEQDALRGQQRWSELNLSDLTEGRRLYIEKCGKCHFPYVPEKYSEDVWLDQMRQMTAKAKLDSSQNEKITRYLLTMRAADSTHKK